MTLDHSQVLSPPQMTDWDGPSVGSQTAAHFREFSDLIKSGDASPHRTFPKGVILYDAPQKGSAFAIQGNDLVFFVRYHLATRSGKTFVTQDEIWLNPLTADENKALKIPRTVFFEILLPKAGRMLCDSHHTRAGRGFWLARCAEALSAGKKVSVWDFASGGVQKMLKVEDIPAEVWGDQPFFQNRRVMIEA